MNDETLIQNGESETGRRAARPLTPTLSPDGSEGETATATQHTRASVGKIGRLPKAIREMLNRRLDDGEPASAIVPWLNELPPVKAVLASYFGGAAISEKNISNWRLTGYQRWVERQELLGEVRELAEEAADLNESNPDGLMRMTATLACTKLLRTLRDDKSGADVTKAAFAIAALNNVELTRVRVEQEERRLGQKDSLADLAWDKHLRDCAAIGHRLMGDWKAKEIEEADIDYSDQIELLGRHMFGDLWQRRRLPGEDEIPGNAGDEEPEVGGTHGPNTPPGVPSATSPGVSPNEDPVQTNANPVLEGEEKTAATQRGPTTMAVTPTTEVVGGMTGETPIPLAEADTQVSPTEGDLKSQISDLKENAGPLADARGSVTTPANLYAGRTTQQLIAEAEDNYARENAVRVNRRREKEAHGGTDGRPLTLTLSPDGGEGPLRGGHHSAAQERSPTVSQGSTAHACGVSPTKGELSAYDKALLEGKTHLEAMYAQATPVEKPKGKKEALYFKPNPLDGFSDSVDAMPRPMPQPSWNPYVMQPPPGWNSLG